MGREGSGEAGRYEVETSHLVRTHRVALTHSSETQRTHAMATIPQNLPEDIQDDSDPWPEAPEATHTPRQAWCAKVQAIAERAKQTLPECSGRVDAAVKLVLAGDVELLPDGQARVQSQANGQMLYRLVNGTCECRDYEHAPSHWCKHRISVGLMKRAGLPPAVEVPDASPHAEPRVTEPVQGIDPQFVVWIQR